jgi:2-polyprenyl-3-methyl-5-hydroxy-6-metoxy-1,4-benzoquinol methylase
MTGESLRPCPLGCPGVGRPLGDLNVTTGGTLSRTHFTLALCQCGQLLYLSPPPSDSDVNMMYVVQDQFGGYEYSDPIRSKRIVRYMRRCLDRIARMRAWPNNRPLRVLEIGAGLSWMCRAAKSKSVSNVTVAQDISPEAMESCPWVDHYVQGEIDDRRLDAWGPYDVISMTHVIEHLVDVLTVVRRCFSLLAPEGVIFVTAPHRPKGWSDTRPDLTRWIAYSYNHVPAHVQYFSKGSMQRLAAIVGCELVHWSSRHDGGQAFEAWLTNERTSVAERWRRRIHNAFDLTPSVHPGLVDD